MQTAIEVLKAEIKSLEDNFSGAISSFIMDAHYGKIESLNNAIEVLESHHNQGVK